MSSSTRKEVLKVYRRALKLAKSWEAADAGKTLKERDFIKEEARTLFRKNKDLTSFEEINEHLREAEARIELAVHYKTPYPRPVNFPQSLVHSSSVSKMARQREIHKHFKPLYTKSNH